MPTLAMDAGVVGSVAAVLFLLMVACFRDDGALFRWIFFWIAAIALLIAGIASTHDGQPGNSGSTTSSYSVIVTQQWQQ